MENLNTRPARRYACPQGHVALTVVPAAAYVVAEIPRCGVCGSALVDRPGLRLIRGGAS